MSSPDRDFKLSRWQRVRRAFSSPSAFHQALILKSSTSILINEDLAPTPPVRQRWTVWSYFAYWWSESWNVSTWSVGAAIITLGATVRDALLIVVFANILSAVVIVLNGRAAARYHIGYPVLSRSSFGIYGQYFVVILRSILGIIWGGVQLYFEGQFISICLRCIFPGWSRIHNSIPASQHITTQEMIGFFLAFCFTIPFLFIHTSRISHLFSVKSVIMPAAGLGIVIWATTKNGGVSSGNLIDPSARTSTAVFAWGLISNFNSIMGSNSALLVTVPDLARYSRTRNAQLWGQLISLPLGQTLCAAFGVITTSAVFNMWGEAYWNPYALLNGILDHTYTSSARAGVFFASASFAFATLGTSIACNFIPFAADVTCLVPKYINIIRGQFLMLLIAFAIVPWRIVATANGFLNFLGGYSIFQGPVVAIMIVDYFWIRRGNITLAELYTRSSHGRYHYFHGFNVRAFVAFVIGFLLPLPGFAASFGYDIGTAAPRMYALGWVLSFLMGALSYAIICFVFKVPGDDGAYPFESKVAEAQEMINEGVPIEGQPGEKVHGEDIGQVDTIHNKDGRETNGAVV